MPSSSTEAGARRFLPAEGGAWLRLGLVLILGLAAVAAPSLERTGAVLTDSATASGTVYSSADAGAYPAAVAPAPLTVASAASGAASDGATEEPTPAVTPTPTPEPTPTPTPTPTPAPTPTPLATDGTVAPGAGSGDPGSGPTGSGAGPGDAASAGPATGVPFLDVGLGGRARR